MEKIIGIDLGTNSIGWAIREVNQDLENQIIDKGVITFNKGVAEDKSGEHPKVQQRTISRGKRRNYNAERYRKWALLECLINNKMCPLTIEELNSWKYYKKNVGRKFPSSDKFIQWLRFDFDGDMKPDFHILGLDKDDSFYAFRAYIIDENKKEIYQNNLHIIGRVFYQMIQHRGYNNIGDLDETETIELSGTIQKGGGDSGAIGACVIEPYIKKYGTLGAALYFMQKENGTRIRKRYNLRSWYEDEIKLICKIYNIENIFIKLRQAIVSQRELRIQKGLVGVCTFINNKKRCPISHPLYEEYRTWIMINNLKIKAVDESKNYLTLSILHNVVYPFFIKANDFKLSSLKKEISKEGFEITANFDDDTKLIPLSFQYRMKSIFGNEWREKLLWEETLSDTQKVKFNNGYGIEDLWHVHFNKRENKLTGQSAYEFVKQFGKNKLNLEEEKAEEFAKIRLDQGYASLCLQAIRKILPYLKQGILYSHAVYLANIKKVLNVDRFTNEDALSLSYKFNEIFKQHNYDKKKAEIVNNLVSLYFDDKELFLKNNRINTIYEKITDYYGNNTWNKLPFNLQKNIENDIIDEFESFLNDKIKKPDLFYIKTKRLHDRIFEYLSDVYKIPVQNIKYLWHPSIQEIYPKAPTKNNIRILGKPEPISKGFKNPMALKTLHKLRQLINYLIENDKIDEDTKIVLEIARELNDANKRKAIAKWQKDREKENQKYLEQINRHFNESTKSIIPSDLKKIIDKVRLWEEQKMVCLYTGKPIEISELLDGSRFDFEHSIPASMSFDNELKNLTIADKRYNQQIKIKKLPTECVNYYNACTINGVEYPAISETMQNLFGNLIKKEVKKGGKVTEIYTYERIDKIKRNISFWKNESKTAKTKIRKDYSIQQRHYYELEYHYWNYKLQSFTITEYKSTWRNSQLRDTQMITKYALPYLKTVFKNVEVQKGNITADFRKIYKIQSSFSTKDRGKHSHHVIDAAVLTLIPTATIRDKILFQYNEAKDNNLVYHCQPPNWKGFKENFLRSIESEVINNYQSENRALTYTRKKIRKNGKLQYQKYIDEYGKSSYKLDENNAKIHMISEGSTIRGQLHKESNFGIIKIPEYLEVSGKSIPKRKIDGSIEFQKNEKRGDDLFIVERISLISDFKSIADFDNIIDPNLRKYLKSEIQNRIDSGSSLEQALINPIYAFGKKIDKNGNPLNPIRHLRVRAKGGGAFIQFPIKVREKHTYKSKTDYKNYDYAQNAEIPVCGLYQIILEDKVIRELKNYSLMDLAKCNLNNNITDTIEQRIIKKIGKISTILPLYATLYPGKYVMFYKDNIRELLDLSIVDISNRLYIIRSFEDGKVYLKHHICSLKEDEIKIVLKNMGVSEKGASSVNLIDPYPKLRLSQGALNFAIEEKHFKLNMDGTINWLIN